MVALFFWFDLQRYLTLAALKANRQALLEFYAAHHVAMVAGVVFGPVMGTVCISATIGATLALLVVRYLLRDAVLNKFGSRLEKINLELETRELNYLLFLRLMPPVPFFLINLAAGLTRLPLRTFFIGTFFGIIPGVSVYVNAGASLSTIDSTSDIASPRVLGSFVLLGLFALMPVLYSKFKSQKTG